MCPGVGNLACPLYNCRKRKPKESHMTDQSRIDLYETIQQVNAVDPSFYERFDVKRGLRNANGSGVVAGVLSDQCLVTLNSPAVVS